MNEVEALAIGLAEAAKELKICERTLWQLAREGKVPHSVLASSIAFASGAAGLDGFGHGDTRLTLDERKLL